MKKSVLAKAVSILLIVILIVGIGCFIFIPELYDMFKGSDIDLFKKHMLIYRLAFYMCYIIGLYIVYRLIGLFNIVYSGSPFNKKLEDTLKVIAVMFMILFLIVIIIGFFLQIIFTEIPLLVGFFSTTQLNFKEWIWICLLSLFPLVVHEIIK